MTAVLSLDETTATDLADALAGEAASDRLAALEARGLIALSGGQATLAEAASGLATAWDAHATLDLYFVKGDEEPTWACAVGVADQTAAVRIWHDASQLHLESNSADGALGAFARTLASELAEDGHRAAILWIAIGNSLEAWTASRGPEGTFLLTQIRGGARGEADDETDLIALLGALLRDGR